MLSNTEKEMLLFLYSEGTFTINNKTHYYFESLRLIQPSFHNSTIYTLSPAGKLVAELLLSINVYKNVQTKIRDLVKYG